MGDVLVFVQVKDGKPHKAGLEALGEGKRLAAKLGGAARAVVIGECATVGDLGKHGAAKILHVNEPDLAQYSPDGYAKVVSKAAKECGAVAVLLGATAQGKDMAPRVAARLDTGYAADITGLSVKDGAIVAKRPVYAGKGFLNVTISGVFVASLRPNVFAPETSGGAVPVEAYASGLKKADLKAVVTEILAAGGGKLDVAEAEIIVSGGRGMKGPEHWHIIENLAKVLGAATGASRAVVDAGWRPHSEQVGQTGKTVSPKLYIAVGVSGAIQHLAGMSSSRVIVAINKDPGAPIFKVANYGIVGDAFEVVPALTEKLKAALAN